MNKAHWLRLNVGSQVLLSNGLSGWQTVTSLVKDQEGVNGKVTHVVIGNVCVVPLESIKLVRSAAVAEYMDKLREENNPREILEIVEHWLGWCDESLNEGLKTVEDAISLYCYWQANNRKLPEFASNTDDDDDYLCATHRFLALGYDPLGEYQGERVKVDGFKPILVEGYEFQEAWDDGSCQIGHGVVLLSTKGALDRQKTWPKDHRLKKFDFRSGSDFFMILEAGDHSFVVDIQGVQGAPNIEDVIDSAAVRFTYFDTRQA